jgi:hypothetical protein
MDKGEKPVVKISNDSIDNLYKEISEFGDFQPGIKYGYDFPEFALALVGSKAFEHWNRKMIADGLMMPALLAMQGLKKPDEKDPIAVKEFEETVMKKSPHKATLLKAMYLGYKLGKAESQE